MVSNPYRMGEKRARLSVDRWANPAQQTETAPMAGLEFELSRETGAGEGIRTLDPNLGKVVLYP